MAGGGSRYRHLSRDSAHRQALLRNLVTSLFQHESITTTWPKAKEAQRLAEKLITLGKKNTEASRRRALEIFYTPHEMLPKLFGPLRERYADRPGGYTRNPAKRTSTSPPKKGDKNAIREPKPQVKAPTAILELVDGPKDIRFAMTARTVAREREQGRDLVHSLTRLNVKKVTQFRKDGVEVLERAISQLSLAKKQNDKLAKKEAEAESRD
ncbi:Ribosomal protein L17 [Penicillium expansum]|nr:Ribosomal protein L17 [Penicillium expansum]